jgi:hypothetical protein
MRADYGTDMELVVIGTESKYATLAKEIWQRTRVVLIPGDEVAVYRFSVQELVGEEAERYIQALLSPAYVVLLMPHIPGPTCLRGEGKTWI